MGDAEGILSTIGVAPTLGEGLMEDKYQRRSLTMGGVLVLWVVVGSFMGLGMQLGGQWEGVKMYRF